MTTVPVPTEPPETPARTAPVVQERPEGVSRIGDTGGRVSEAQRAAERSAAVVKLTLLAESIRGEAMMAARIGQMDRLEQMADEVQQVADWLRGGA